MFNFFSFPAVLFFGIYFFLLLFHMGALTHYIQLILRMLGLGRLGVRKALFALPIGYNFHVFLDGSLILRRDLEGSLRRISTLGLAFVNMFQHSVVDLYMGAGGTRFACKRVTWRIDYANGGMPSWFKALLQYWRYRESRKFQLDDILEPIGFETTFPLRVMAESGADVTLDDIWGNMEARRQLFAVMCEAIARLALPPNSVLEIMGWHVRTNVPGAASSVEMLDGMYILRCDDSGKIEHGLVSWPAYFQDSLRISEPCHESEGDMAVVSLAAAVWAGSRRTGKGRPVIIESADVDVLCVALSLAAAQLDTTTDFSTIQPLYVVRHFSNPKINWTDWSDVVDGYRMLMGYMSLFNPSPPPIVPNVPMPLSKPHKWGGSASARPLEDFGITAQTQMGIPWYFAQRGWHCDPVVLLQGLLYWSGADFVIPPAQVRFMAEFERLRSTGVALEDIAKRIGNGEYSSIWDDHKYEIWWDMYCMHYREIGALFVVEPVNSLTAFRPRAMAINVRAFERWWVYVMPHISFDSATPAMGNSFRDKNKVQFMQRTTWTAVRAMAHRLLYAVSYYYNGWRDKNVRATGLETFEGKSLYGIARDPLTSRIVSTDDVADVDLLFCTPELQQQFAEHCR